MGRVFLLDGTTGAGKSTALHLLTRAYAGTVVVGRKLTTRPSRDHESDVEFLFVERIPSTATYAFESVGHRYAVDENQLRRALDDGRSYAVTCVDRDTLVRLKSLYPTTVIYIYRPTIDFSALMAARGTRDADEVERRRSEIENIPNEYAAKVDLYDHVLLNVGSTENLNSQLVQLLRCRYGIVPDAIQFS